MESVYFFILHATGFRVEPAVDDGDDHQGQEGAGEEAPDDGNGHGLLDFRPFTPPEGERDQPQDGGGGRHQNGAQAGDSRIDDGLSGGDSSRFELIDVIHQHNRIIDYNS